MTCIKTEFYASFDKYLGKFFGWESRQEGNGSVRRKKEEPSGISCSYTFQEAEYNIIGMFNQMDRNLWSWFIKFRQKTQLSRKMLSYLMQESVELFYDVLFFDTNECIL